MTLNVNEPLNLSLLTKVNRNYKDGEDECQLYVHNLHRMDCRNRKCCGLFVFVVQFVKVLVEERQMVDSV
jgi:hypothetical protein